VQVDSAWASPVRSNVAAITVNTVPSINVYNVPDGVVDWPYDFTFGAIGTAPITWDIESGSLPPGLTLSNGGRLSGTPTQEGTFAFTVRAQNVADYHDRVVELIIRLVPEITTYDAPDGVIDLPYGFTFGATGTAPILWSV